LASRFGNRLAKPPVLVPITVIGGTEIDCVLVDTLDHYITPRQPAFGVTHGRGVIAVDSRSFPSIDRWIRWAKS
jgi:hypothetical protein